MLDSPNQASVQAADLLVGLFGRLLLNTELLKLLLVKFRFGWTLLNFAVFLFHNIRLCCGIQQPLDFV